MIDLMKIQNLICNYPASDIEIDNTEKEMKIKLPIVYKELLKHTNGFSTDSSLLIYGTHEIVERNQIWEVDDYAKGYIAIGDDGGGNVFLMQQNTEAKAVLVVDSGDMTPGNATTVTCDFINWVSNGCIISNGAITNSLPDICNIVLLDIPSGGLKDLLQIKTVIGLDMPMGELLKGSRNLPFVLSRNFPYGKAKKLLDRLGTLGTVLKLVTSKEKND